MSKTWHRWNIIKTFWKLQLLCGPYFVIFVQLRCHVLFFHPNANLDSMQTSSQIALCSGVLLFRMRSYLLTGKQSWRMLGHMTLSEAPWITHDRWRGLMCSFLGAGQSCRVWPQPHGHIRRLLSQSSSVVHQQGIRHEWRGGSSVVGVCSRSRSRLGWFMMSYVTLVPIVVKSSLYPLFGPFKMNGINVTIKFLMFPYTWLWHGIITSKGLSLFTET